MNVTCLDRMGVILILSKENTLLINLTCLILTALICSHVPSEKHIPRVMMIQTRPIRTRNRTLHNKNLTTRYRALSNKIY